MNEDKRVRIADILGYYGPYMAFAVALAAMMGSLYFSEIAHFIPCELCWYQRILMYPLSMIILIGIIKQDDYLPSYILPLSIIGIFTSSYHYLLQLGIITKSACSSALPCNSSYVNYFGFVTIPFMALTAFILITLIMFATRWAYMQDVEVEE